MARTIAALAAAALFPLLAFAQQVPTLRLSQLAWFNREGTRVALVGPLADHGNVELSPDGRRVAVAIGDRASGSHDIWMYDVSSGERTRFTEDDQDENWMIWSPDGRHVIHNVLADGRLDLFEAPTDDAGSRTLLAGEPYQDKWPVSWSPDGRYLLYVVTSRTTNDDILILPLDGDHQPAVFIKTRAAENWATFSPDGTLVAFTSTESGKPEVYVSPFPPNGQKSRISADGGIQPRWRRDGKAIFYLDPNRTLIEAQVERAGTEVATTTADPLFQITYPYETYHAFDVAPDAQRFLVNTRAIMPRGPSLLVSR